MKDRRHPRETAEESRGSEQHDWTGVGVGVVGWVVVVVVR